jgi:integrase
MASIHKQPGKPNWFAAFIGPDGQRHFRSTGTPEKSLARRVALEFEQASRAARAGRLNESTVRKTLADLYALANGNQLSSSTIRDFFQAWLKRKSIEASDRTYERYETVVQHLLKCLGPKASKDISHLSAKDITDLRDNLSASLSPSSANYAVKVLRVALNQARRDGVVDTNEASRVSLIQRLARSQRRPFTLPELKSILLVANDEWRGMILTGLYSGLRLGDVAELTWSSLDLKNAKMTVQTGKTGRIVDLPIAAPLLNHFLSLPAGDDPQAPLFPDAYGARTRSHYGGTISNQFHEILVDAGLAKDRPHTSIGKGRGSTRQPSVLSFHSLRHTATSLLKNAGVSDAVARDIIGHESEAVSRNYTHIDMETKRKAVDAMPDVLAMEAESKLTGSKKQPPVTKQRPPASKSGN